MCGALKRARLVHPGVAEVVFVKKDDAITAYKKYNNRCLDGESEKAATSPSHSSLLLPGSSLQSRLPLQWVEASWCSRLPGPSVHQEQAGRCGLWVVPSCQLLSRSPGCHLA